MPGMLQDLLACAQDLGGDSGTEAPLIYREPGGEFTDRHDDVLGRKLIQCQRQNVIPAAAAADAADVVQTSAIPMESKR